jgi:hypothetical protein
MRLLSEDPSQIRAVATAAAPVTAISRDAQPAFGRVAFWEKRSALTGKPWPTGSSRAEMCLLTGAVPIHSTASPCMSFAVVKVRSTT